MIDGITKSMVWFTGVVEDVSDPEELGRVKVRCIGYHNDKLNELPTEDLPWATPMMPITSASISGIAESATGLLVGSWVVGFFADGKFAQDPIVMGTIQSRTFNSHKPIKGEAPAAAEDRANSGFKTEPREDGNPDIPAMATSRYEDSSFFETKKNLRQQNIPMAIAPELSTLQDGGASTDRMEWNMLNPEDTTEPIYPSNHVKEYESGHLFEVDETTNYERISETHKSGTYREITADGDNTLCVKGDNYKVVFQDEKVLIKGQCSVTIDGNSHCLVKGDHFLEVEGNKHELVHGSVFKKYLGSEMTEVGDEYGINITSNYYTRCGGDFRSTISGNRDIVTFRDNTDIIVGDNTQLCFGNNYQHTTLNYSINAGASISLSALTTATVSATTDVEISALGTIRNNALMIFLN